MLLTDLEDDEVRKLLEYLGFIAIGWGMVERAIDWLVTRTLDIGGKALVKGGKRPRQISGKIEYLKKVFSELPELVGHKESVLSDLEDVENYADIRHHIMHGIIESVDQESMVVSKLVLTQAIEYSNQRMDISFRSLPEMGGALLHLSVSLGKTSQELLR